MADNAEREHTLVEADWQAYEAWAQDLTDAQQVEHMTDYLTQLKSATGQAQTQPDRIYRVCTVAIDGWRLFREWEMANRWPA